MHYFRFMRLTLLLSISLLWTSITFSQGSFFLPSDSLHKGRTIGVSTGIGTVWSGSIIGLSKVWYSDADKAPWHTFDDSRNWLQMDKAGHFYTAYKLNQLTTDLYRWSGVNRKASIWIGAGVSIGYQSTFEFLDAYSAEWGFSWSDVAANTLGTAVYTGQMLAWNEERIIPKFSYHPTEFAAVRPSVLGSSFAESMLKDYNGQTYWLSFSPGTFFKNSGIPKWACISFGYSAHAKLVGSEDFYTDPATNISYTAQREFLFSLDIDFSKLKIRKPWLRALVRQFNYLKLPFPALIIRGNKIFGSPLYF